MKLLEKYFNENDHEFLKKSLQARIDAQYYIDRTVPDETYTEMIKTAPRFLARCKDVLAKLTEDEVNSVRNRIEEIRKVSENQNKSKNRK